MHKSFGYEGEKTEILTVSGDKSPTTNKKLKAVQESGSFHTTQKVPKKSDFWDLTRVSKTIIYLIKSINYKKC